MFQEIVDSGHYLRQATLHQWEVSFIFLIFKHVYDSFIFHLLGWISFISLGEGLLYHKYVLFAEWLLLSFSLYSWIIWFTLCCYVHVFIAAFCFPCRSLELYSYFLLYPLNWLQFLVFWWLQFPFQLVNFYCFFFIITTNDQIQFPFHVFNTVMVFRNSRNIIIRAFILPFPNDRLIGQGASLFHK